MGVVGYAIATPAINNFRFYSHFLKLFLTIVSSYKIRSQQARTGCSYGVVAKAYNVFFFWVFH